MSTEERENILERAQYVLQTAGVQHAQLRRHYAEALYEADLLRMPRTHEETVAYWNKFLSDLLDERFEDGTSVFQYILLTNPDLERRFRRVLFGE